MPDISIKFLVLNSMYQPVNPYKFNFFPVNPYKFNFFPDQKDGDHKLPAPPKNTYHMCLFTDQGVAKKFAEFMAKTQLNQVFHLAQVLGQVRSDPPVIWEE